MESLIRELHEFVKPTANGEHIVFAATGRFPYASSLTTALSCNLKGGQMLSRFFSLILGLMLLSGTPNAQANTFLSEGEAPDFSAFTQSTDEPLNEEPVKAKIFIEEKNIQPGRPFWVAVQVDLEHQWHTYWKNAGDIGLPTSLDWHLPPGFEIASVEWPTPKRFFEHSMVSFGYDDTFVILAKITPGNATPVGKNADIGVTVRWVACNEGNCLPGESEAKTAVMVSQNAPISDNQSSTLFSQARSHLPMTGWSVKSDVSNNTVRLVLHPPQGQASSFALAYFVPITPETINLHQPIEVKPLATGEGYTISLHKQAKGKPLSSHLEGILLLHPSADTKEAPAAVAIHTPLEDHAVADASGTSTASIFEEEMDSMIVEFEGGMGLALLMAFVGGMILNLMPCVLPVISLKVLSIVKMSGKSRLANVKHGLIFGLGVLVSFWVLAIVLLLLQAYGHAVGWGFQLQEPIFVALLAAVLLMFSLSLFGVFEMGTVMASWAGQTESDNVKQGSSLSGSFFNGVLATAVATPCTGPFLGSAIGFAVTLPPLSALAIFTSLGIGMASPYMLLTSFPSLVKWLPKPGAWMVTFKQLMGFLLMATILWLLWVFGAQTDNLGIFLLLCSLFILSLACWTYGHWCTPLKSKRVRKAGILVSAFLVLLGTYFLVVSASLVPENNEKALANQMITGEEDLRAWLPFTPALVEQYRQQGKPVFIDFTAKWCVICQTNHLILVLDDVEKKFADMGVVKFKADWTRPDPAITKELRKYGRNGVPLYLLYAPGSTTPLILPQVLTPDVVSGYLDKIRGAVDNAKTSSESPNKPVAHP